MKPRLSTAAFGIEASLAQHRAAAFLDGARLERNLTLCTALAANGIVHCTVGCALALASDATILATLGRGEALLGKELLLTFGEGKILAAIAASELLISHTNERKEVNRFFLLSCTDVDVKSKGCD